MDLMTTLFNIVLLCMLALYFRFDRLFVSLYRTAIGIRNIPKLPVRQETELAKARTIFGEDLEKALRDPKFGRTK